MPSEPRVAIIGGSLAGITLSRGLLQHPHIRFDCFDVKSSFRERGAGVTLDTNAQEGLRAMRLDSDGELAAAGAVHMTSTYCLVSQGQHKGKRILTLPGGTRTVARDRWLDQLLKPIPEDRLHAAKKLQAIDEPKLPGEPYVLHFEDGTTHAADAVIGCDGIRGEVRKQVLGSENQAALAPVFGGYWDTRGRISVTDAAKKFGTDLFDPREKTHRVGLVGNGSFMLFSASDDGAVYHVIMTAKAKPSYDVNAWKHDLSREFLLEYFSEWDEKHRDAVMDCILDESGLGVVFSEWESPATATYSKGGLALMGDAAHAMIPWMGQGACQSTEDASVMAALVGAVKDPKDFPAAFGAFDRVRRGRAEYAVNKSHDVAELLTGQYGLDPSKTDALDIPGLWKPIWELNIPEHIKQALAYFEVLKVKEV